MAQAGGDSRADKAVQGSQFAAVIAEEQMGSYIGKRRVDHRGLD